MLEEGLFMEHLGIAGDGFKATKKEIEEGEGEAGQPADGAFSIKHILGRRKDFGRRREVPSFLPPPLPSHLPLFQALPPIFPFLPFTYNSVTRTSSPPAHKKVGFF